MGTFQDSLSSLLLKHRKPEPNAIQTAFTGEIHINWNGPLVSRADHLIRASLDHCTGLAAETGGISRLVSTSKLYTSEVVIRKMFEVS